MNNFIRGSEYLLFQTEVVVYLGIMQEWNQSYRNGIQPYWNFLQLPETRTAMLGLHQGKHTLTAQQLFLKLIK